MNIRQIALRILDEYEAGGKYVNLALSSHLTDGLSREDKAALTALLYTAVEKKLSYDYYILALSGRSEDAIEPHTKNILRLGLCQLLDMRSIPDFAAVNETVKLAANKGEAAFVNAVLRAASAKKDNLPMPDEKKKHTRCSRLICISAVWSMRFFICCIQDSTQSSCMISVLWILKNRLRNFLIRG